MASERGGELTPAQAAYGQAMAWKSALLAKLSSENRRLMVKVPLTEPENEIGASADPRPACEVRLVAEPPEFPQAKRIEGGFGAVALKLLTSDAGEVVRVQVAGSVGGKAFVDSAVEAAREWRYEQDGSPQSGCRMTKESFMAVRFAYKG
jgi:TonB family protein